MVIDNGEQHLTTAPVGCTTQRFCVAATGHNACLRHHCCRDVSKNEEKHQLLRILATCAGHLRRTTQRCQRRACYHASGRATRTYLGNLCGGGDAPLRAARAIMFCLPPRRRWHGDSYLFTIRPSAMAERISIQASAKSDESPGHCLRLYTAACPRGLTPHTAPASLPPLVGQTGIGVFDIALCINK